MLALKFIINMSLVDRNVAERANSNREAFFVPDLNAYQEQTVQTILQQATPQTIDGRVPLVITGPTITRHRFFMNQMFLPQSDIVDGNPTNGTELADALARLQQWSGQDGQRLMTSAFPYINLRPYLQHEENMARDHTMELLSIVRPVIIITLGARTTLQAGMDFRAFLQEVGICRILSILTIECIPRLPAC